MDASDDSKRRPAENRAHACGRGRTWAPPSDRRHRTWAPPSDGTDSCRTRVPLFDGNGGRGRSWAPLSDGNGGRGRSWAPPSDDIGSRRRTWTPPSDCTGGRSRQWAPPCDGTGGRGRRSWAPLYDGNGGRGRCPGAPAADGTGGRGRSWAPPSDGTGSCSRPWKPPSDGCSRQWAPPSDGTDSRSRQWAPPSDGTRPYASPAPQSWCDRHYYRPVIMDDDLRTVVHTKVTSSGAAVVHFLRRIKEYLRRNEVHNHIVGLDTEWRHNNRPGEPRYRIAVLQLCVGNLCLLFQIDHADHIPDELRDFLADPEFCFAAVAVAGDVTRLVEDCGMPVANTVDLPKEAAAVLGRGDLRQSGLATLAREVMGMSMEKSKRVTMSNWAARRLTAEQVRYACVDAFVSYDVGRRLRVVSRSPPCNPQQPSSDAVN